ncbi:phenylalanine--tRNA ligase subunit beta [Sphingomonas sp. MMS24-J45]|uniref:phenylalanine--tRNA ligase subunit beta n=1 Tax=Sphingomonas sp. MMS24-J45 TaxID=3238806 RepID=UPI003850EFC5
MKTTLGWLKEHIETDATLDTIVETLTRIGLEVEGVENPGERLAAFKIARVLSAAPHPQADKLQVLSVDAGDGPLQVVCGAPNARAGMVGVFGPSGAVVPSNGMVLKVAAIRGVESNGMMCSSRELELGDDHDGIIELPADAPVGTAFPDYAGLNDPVIDINVLPNRPDCFGARGIALDLVAAGLGTAKPLTYAAVEGTGPGPDVRTEDTDGCPAFFATSVSGLTNGEAPEWMRRRLTAIGQRPISTLVDITNYVMFDLGRPLHVYDRAKLSGGLVARKSKDGEQVVAINGKTYTLSESMTVIADADHVHDIGGIMGGEDSGVSAETTDVIIECAYFDPEGIARTGQKLLLTSDARSRFERGVDPAFLAEGLQIATRLVLDLCGGTPSEPTHAGTPPVTRKRIAYDPTLAERLGGLAVAEERQREILAALGFEVEADWTVLPPPARRDVDGPADLVEEIIRIVGIDSVPATPLPRTPGVAKPTATPAQALESRVRRAAAARGLNEALTWSFLSDAQAAAIGGGAWSLANPISEELKVMRPSLLPGLFAAAERNMKRGAPGVRLFELGRRYLAEGERPTLGVVLAGENRPRGWQDGKATAFTAFDAKAEALALLAAAGAPVENLQVMGEAGDAWHPGQSGTLRLGPKTVLAAFGMVHPLTTRAFDLDGPVAAVELYLDALPAKRTTGFARAAYAPPALQAVRRDFAFLVPEALAADALVRAVKGADKASIVAARLFDVFVGTGVEPGHKSLGVEVTLQPGDKSFTEADLKAVADKVVAAAAKLGASLRG